MTGISATPEPSDDELAEIEASIVVDPLETLFAEAQVGRASAPLKKVRRATDPSMRNALDATAKRMKDRYLLAENWIRERGVALMHKESQTLLGNFSEYRHLDGKSTKLLRESSLIPIDEVREVSGTWWLEPLAREHIEAVKNFTTQRHEIVPLHLDRLRVYSPAAPICLFLQFGGIMRVELTEDTQFASANGEAIITLSKGVNVYEVMETEGKVALRKEITL